MTPTSGLTIQPLGDDCAAIVHDASGLRVLALLHPLDAPNALRELLALPVDWRCRAADLHDHGDLVRPIYLAYADRHAARTGGPCMTDAWGSRVRRGERLLHEDDRAAGRPFGTWRDQKATPAR